jgi:hypothetical protein
MVLLNELAHDHFRRCNRRKPEIRRGLYDHCDLRVRSEIEDLGA